jgi:enoyl-[acyl-carrier protein] reductase III
MEHNKYNFKGKVALVTGGSRGIGRACVLRLAQDGADVLINYFSNEEAARKVQAEAEALGVKAIIVQGDVSDEADVTRIVETAEKEFGRLDFLVSNAIGFSPELMEKVRTNPKRRQVDIPPEFFDRALSIQARAMLLCSREASNLMAKNPDGGRIIAISSVGSFRVAPNYLAPGTAKAALEAVTRYIAVDLAKQNIIVNCVSGAAVETEALQYLTRDIQKFLEASASRTPLKRPGQPEDLAAVVAFLCTPEGGWICGQTIIADGGFTLVN